ncbi:MAG: hypothetical protein F6K35_32835 [Okeania sp. SIO2H7]|nr:hypothetical protein [Okeania sp. SIO2H7]
MLLDNKIELQTLPIGAFFGVSLDFQFLASDILKAGKELFINAQKLGAKMIAGAQALIESLRNGTFGQIFSQWARESPLAAGAGVLAAGLAGGVILIVGGAVIGTAAGAIATVVKGIAGTNLGQIFLTGLVGGGLVGGIGTALINFSQFIWNFNWNQSDKEIKKEIESAITNLYTPAGDVLGRGLATLLVGGKWQPSRVEINVRQAAINTFSMKTSEMR